MVITTLLYLSNAVRKRNKLINICLETCIVLCAFSIFLLLLCIGTWMLGEVNCEITPDKPFSMYVWHYNENEIVKIADICGTGHENTNAFIHVRQEKNKSAEVILWLYENNFEKYAQYNVSVKFDSVTFNRTCTYKVNNDTLGVLYINNPYKVIKQMTKNETFDIALKNRNKVIDTFHYNSESLTNF